MSEQHQRLLASAIVRVNRYEKALRDVMAIAKPFERVPVMNDIERIAYEALYDNPIVVPAARRWYIENIGGRLVTIGADPTRRAVGLYERVEVVETCSHLLKVT